MRIDDLFLVIPTLNPNEDCFYDFLLKCQKYFKYILVYDDGSETKYLDFFKKVEKRNIVVLKHYKNLGKGRALKDAFNYILVKHKNIKGVVCADSDGQHDVLDIIECGRLVLSKENTLVLGCRDFNDKMVPFRNGLGNKINRGLFKIFAGLDISDTQTGLRGMDRIVMAKYLDTDGERFNYENNQLLDLINKGINLREFKIKTIYNEVSKSESHFRPFKDSLAIFKTFIKYILGSLSSFFLDIVLFVFFLKMRKNIVFSTILARIISSIYNYFINLKIVFKNRNKFSFIKYYILVFLQMLISSFGTYVFHVSFDINAIGIKILVDLALFIVNYYIQKKYIFKN